MIHLKNFIFLILKPLRPIFYFTLLKNTDRLREARESEANQTSSGMVSKFNFWQPLFFERFFLRVKTVRADIDAIRELMNKGPVVFVLKNRGQIEYRFFNTLFVKESLPLVSYANDVITFLWRPFSQILQYARFRLDDFYTHGPRAESTTSENLALHLRRGEHVLVNLSVSRDYLFGLIRTNPLEHLRPLLSLQKELTQNITIVPLQFLYDKHPDKTDQSFFDLLFGNKANPGGIRKLILFVLSWRRHPQANFGTPISLKEFIEHNANANQKDLETALNQKIEETLSIQQVKVTGPKLKSKEKFLQDIYDSESFKATLESISQKSGEPLKTVEKKSRHYLEEIAADVNYSYIEFAWVALSYLWNNIFDGVVIKQDQLNRIRQMMGKDPVVLVPMHRSHIDYLLISYVFFSQNLTFPHICGGINLNFFPVGRFIRKCGGFFIRRRFDGNIAYKESFYAYVKALVEQGYCIEFFIEGTRSRTGKLLRPKMGFLGFLVRAFFETKRDDIHFVPIAINYDQILEQKSYQTEGAGSDKSKENAGELLKVRKVLNKKYGKVYIEFAEPISLKSYLQKRGIDRAHPPADLRPVIQDVAYHITYHMNRVAIVTPISLVSLAALSFTQKAFSFDDLISRVAVLKDYLDYKKANYTDLIHYSDRWAYSEALQKLVQRGTLKEVKSFEGVFYTLTSESRASLDFYKNNILHFFVSLVSCLKILSTLKVGETLSMDMAIKKYEIFKTLFEQDFIFSIRHDLKDHLIKVFRYLADKNWIAISEDQSTFTRLDPEFSELNAMALTGLLDNFLESHTLTLRYLKHNRFQNLEMRTLIKDILEKSQPLYLKEDLRYLEALNRFNIESSVKFSSDVGLVKIESKDGKVFCTITPDLELVDSWIQKIGELTQTAHAEEKKRNALTAPKTEQPTTTTDELH